jgi:hypothetical protein
LKRRIDLDRRQQEDHDGQKGEESEEQESQEKSRSEKIREEIVEEVREKDFQEKSQEAGKESSQEGRTEEEASEESGPPGAEASRSEASRSETASSEAAEAAEASEASEARPGREARFVTRSESAAVAASGVVRRRSFLRLRRLRRQEIRRWLQPAQADDTVWIAFEGRSTRCGLFCLVRIALRQQPIRLAGLGFRNFIAERCAEAFWTAKAASRASNPPENCCRNATPANNIYRKAENA